MINYQKKPFNKWGHLIFSCLRFDFRHVFWQNASFPSWDVSMGKINNNFCSLLPHLRRPWCLLVFVMELMMTNRLEKFTVYWANLLLLLSVQLSRGYWQQPITHQYQLSSETTRDCHNLDDLKQGICVNQYHTNINMSLTSNFKC